MTPVARRLAKELNVDLTNVAGTGPRGRVTEDDVRAAATGPAPGRPYGFPQGCVQNTRVVGVDAQVDGAGFVAAEEDAFPILAAVPGTKHAALFVRPKGVAQGGNVDQVGVVGVDADAGNVAGVLQPQVDPGLAGIG